MGRGLGLPAALGIIQNHGGCLTLESSENHGTTLHVFLPRLQESQEAKTVTRGKAGRKILVVDDEPPVLEFVSTGLQLNGFEVITATNGFEAMEKINQQKEEIGLVILDVFMSGLDGKEVYRQIKAIRPDIRIALSSGYDEQVALAGLALQERDTFLQKPYDLKALLELADNVGDEEGVNIRHFPLLLSATGCCCNHLSVAFFPPATGIFRPVTRNGCPAGTGKQNKHGKRQRPVVSPAG